MNDTANILEGIRNYRRLAADYILDVQSLLSECEPQQILDVMAGTSDDKPVLDLMQRYGAATVMVNMCDHDFDEALELAAKMRERN